MLKDNENELFVTVAHLHQHWNNGVTFKPVLFQWRNYGKFKRNNGEFRPKNKKYGKEHRIRIILSSSLFKKFPFLFCFHRSSCISTEQYEIFISIVIKV